MKRGSFNKIYKIGKLVLKIDTKKDKFSNLIMKEIDSKNYIKYQKDLNSNGIKTSKIYFYMRFPVNILIEKNIKGNSLQEILEDEKINLKYKLLLVKKLLLIYKQIENNKVCIDFNFKNFILNQNELVYIDFVPSLYKSKIEKISNKDLKDYKELYTNKEIQLTSIMNYLLRALIYLSKEELIDIKTEISEYIEKNFNTQLLQQSDNVVIKKMKLLNKYIYENIDKKEYNEEYKKINKR